jgi:ABC-type transport system involved in multi-copper enzyme maturation permease subunit
MNAAFRLRQIRTVARVELRRTAGSRRLVALSLFCLIPVGLAVIRLLMLPEAARMDLGRTSHELAQVFSLFHLRFIVFFGCAFLFVRSFRGEVLLHTLHLGFLLPIRREDLIAGKFLGTLVVSLGVLIPSTLALVMTYYLANGVGNTLRFLGSSQGLGHLASYLLITTLAAIGYGALFFLAGLFFKNPMVPAVMYLGFELIAPFLPLGLSIFSIARQLHALVPVPPSLGPLTPPGSEIPGWSAVILILSVSAAAVRLAGWKARRFEIDYS